MSNLSTLPKGDSAWLLRKAIERIIQQVSVLETNIGASTTGNSANTQVIFNDAGVLRGDPDLIFNTALNKLVATNLESTTALVVGTTATITGDLTVDTSTLKVDSTNNRVGVVQATPLYPLHLVGEFGLEEASSGNGTKLRLIGDATKYNFRLGKQLTATNTFEITPSTAVGGTTFSNPVYTVTYDGIHTFLDGAGGTRMTLNSIGLGVGGIVTGTGPTILVEGTAGTYAKFNSKVASKTWSAGYRSGTTQFEIQEDGTERFVIANGGNVGIGVTPSVKLDVLSAAAEGTIRLTSTIDGSNASPKASSLSLRSGSASVETARIASFNRFANVGGGDLVFSTADTSAVLQTRATIDSSGNLLVGVTSANANGGVLQLKSGITFPATQVAASDANTLDDYEEGTWTIGLEFGGASTSMTTNANTGKYTKIGRQVTVTGYLALTNKGSATGDAVITGLPFLINSYGGLSIYLNTITFADFPMGYSNNGTSTIPLRECTNAGVVSSLTDADFANNSEIIFTMTYTVA